MKKMFFIFTFFDQSKFIGYLKWKENYFGQVVRIEVQTKQIKSKALTRIFMY